MNERLFESLKGMLESYKILLLVFKENEYAQGAVKGSFYGEISKAEELINEYSTKYPKASE